MGENTGNGERFMKAVGEVMNSCVEGEGSNPEDVGVGNNPLANGATCCCGGGA